MYRRAEIKLMLSDKTNASKEYKFINKIEDINIPDAKNKKNDPQNFLNSLSIKKIKTIFAKLILHYFLKLSKSEDFYGILIDLLKSKKFIGKMISQQGIKFPSYYNVYNFVDLILLLREIDEVESLKEILSTEIVAYIFETKEPIEFHSKNVNKETLESIACDLSLYFSKKSSTDEIDPDKMEYIRSVLQFTELVTFEDSIYGLIFDDIIEDGLMFSINTSVMCDKIAYPWYGVSIIKIENQNPTPIYEGEFMSSPNVRVENSQICLGSLSTNILTNYSSLEYGNLTSPLKRDILNYQNLPLYLKAIKQLTSEEILKIFNKIGG